LVLAAHALKAVSKQMGQIRIGVHFQFEDRYSMDNDNLTISP
jgi:hypothetical protein